MAEFRIKVSTETLVQAADSVNRLVGEMRSAYDELGRVVAGTSGYWIGKAGDSRRQMYESGRERADEMLKFLAAYPTDLLKMAGIYVETETANADAPASLSSDVII